MGRHIYWGDAHTNVHPRHIDRLDAVFEEAARRLDFLAIAYYPFVHPAKNGLLIESWGQRDEFLDDWETVCETAARFNRPGEFVAFPGYEWHGNRTRWGDVNVFYNGDSAPLLATEDLADLIDELRELGGIAVPHHTGYQLGDRGKDWSVHDPDVCPMAEVFSVHGNSEAIDAPLPMVRNGDMGPRVSGGTIQDGLARGHRFGLIGSSESHGLYPARWGCGLMAARADDLSRDALWDAFRRRRVYGVTGDRIRLDVSFDGHEMGEAFSSAGPVEIAADVAGRSSLDRVEILRDNRVVHTYCHRGRWRPPESGTVRARWRIIGLGGPSRHTGFDALEPHPMDLAVDVPGGQVLSVEPCFSAPGQRIREREPGRAAWHLEIPPRERNSTPNGQGVIVEFEADVDGRLGLSIDGDRHEVPVAQALRTSRVIPLIEEAKERVWDAFDLSAGEVGNRDAYYHNAHKVLVERADPEASYSAQVEFVDEDAEPGATHWYYVRVSQDNGQMAWSSPVWLEPA